MKRLLATSALFIMALVVPAARAAPTTDLTAVRAELLREAGAWNRGDLDGFLSGYDRAALFVGATRIYRGRDAIRAMYHQHYADRRRMGALTFTELDGRPLGPGYALAVGRWHLDRPAADGGPAGGFFTLTLHHGGDGWRILVDHTS
jgi:ketosteroid isomerase-like protein